MKNKVQAINPQILIWAREKSGRSISEVALKLKKTPKEIEAWEKGVDYPTYAQLEKLAYELYKRPIAIFFFPEPPEETELHQSFRTLPQSQLDTLTPDVRLKLRDAQAFQLSLYELTGGKNPAKRKIFKDIRINATDTANEIAKTVRRYLGIDIITQTEKWHDVEEALQNWRQVIGDNGIYILKNTIKEKEVSGFCIYNSEFPLIYLNNSTSKNRQIFSIFHELAHLLLQNNGITMRSFNYIQLLTESAKLVEVFCNAFAGEFLVPKEHFNIQTQHKKITDDYINEMANFYKVSREVILRRLLDNKTISLNQFTKKISQLDDEYITGRSSGGSYYYNQVTYLGESYLRLVFQKYYEGSIDIHQVADHLHINESSITGIEQRLFESMVNK